MFAPAQVGYHLDNMMELPGMRTLLTTNPQCLDRLFKVAAGFLNEGAQGCLSGVCTGLEGLLLMMWLVRLFGKELLLGHWQRDENQQQQQQPLQLRTKGAATHTSRSVCRQRALRGCECMCSLPLAGHCQAVGPHGLSHPCTTLLHE